MQYDKPALSVLEQIEQLQARGMRISDIEEAQCFFKNISYYRLAGYWWPMQSDKSNHIFKPNSKLEDVLALYNFDRELRLLVFGAIERIEIALRTKLIYHLSHEINPWWFEEPSVFHDSNQHRKTLEVIDKELSRAKEEFIKDHRQRYRNDHRRPPAWKTLEVVSFGSLSMLYGNLRSRIEGKKVIAKEFSTVNHTYLPSWLQSIAQIRNICAHHGRLWNKRLPGRPKLLSAPPAPWLINVPHPDVHHMLYIHLCCIQYLLNACNDGVSFGYRLKLLLEKYTNVDLKALGMERQWQEAPLWQNSFREEIKN